MQTVSTLFERRLTEIVTQEIESERDAISTGQFGLEDYKFHAGKLAGMVQVLGYFDEVNKLLDEGR